MKRLLSSIVDIRKGEGILVTLMFAYYYVILITYYFLKPARDSLFLVRLGPEQLPLVFILIALIVAPVTTLYSRSARSYSLTRVMNVTLVILIANLFFLRWLIELDQSWVYFVFYIWVSIYAVLGTSQFWLLANTIFDPAQAKRVFWFLNLGGILGAMTGGEVTSLIVRHFGVSTENLLFACMGLLGCCVLILNAIGLVKKQESGLSWSRFSVEEESRESFSQMIRTIRGSKQLTYIVGILSMGMLMATFVDFQFKTVSVEAFPEKEELTGFLGTFYSRLSIVSLFIQSFLTYRILRVFGVGGAIRFLPVGLLVGSIGMVIMPGLWMGVLLRGMDGSFRYSIDKTGRELLFLPLPVEVKKRTKVFIDMFWDRMFRGIGGGLLLIFTVWLDLSLRQISLAILPVLIIWVVLTVLARREYVSAFRKALRRRELDPRELKMDITEASTVDALLETLQSSNERSLIYALEMLASVEHVDLVTAVQPLLRHSSPEVRYKALQLLNKQRSRLPITGVEELIKDQDPRVRREAVSFLLTGDRERNPTRVREWLNHADPRVQAATVAHIAESGSREEQVLITPEVIEGLVSGDGNGSEDLRMQVVEGLGTLRAPWVVPFLMNLREDPSPRVTQAVIRSAGRLRDRQFVPWLIAQLSVTRYRSEARCALAAYGTHILGTLYDYVTDETVPLSVRMNIPRVLSSIPEQEAVEVLMKSFENVHHVLCYPVMKALNKLRTQHAHLKFDPQKIEEWLRAETRSYYENLQVLHVTQVSQNADAGNLLVRAIRERMTRNIEMIFRLLGLSYPAKDIYSAYCAFVSQQQRVRASAIEFIDSVVKNHSKRYLFPIIDGVPETHLIRTGEELFGLRIANREEALTTLMEGRDPWLKACALYSLMDPGQQDSGHFAKEASQDEDPIVRETAHLVVREGR